MNDRLIRSLVRLAVAALLCCSSTRADELKPIAHEDAALGRPIEFERDVYPILEANCIACHNVTVSEGDLILENIEAILKGGGSGPAVVPEKPDDSLLYKLARRGDEPVMPPIPNDRQAKQLTPKQLGLLRQWILEGAKAGGTMTAKAMNWQPINARLQGVYSLDIDPVGRFIAAGRSNHVSVYDMARKDVVGALVDPEIISSDTKGPSGAAHLDYVHAIAFHPTEPLIATSGYRNVKLWRRDSGSVAAAWAVPADIQSWCSTADGTEICIAVASKGIVVASAATSAKRGVVSLDGQSVAALSVFQSEPKWIVAATADARLVVIRGGDLQVIQRSEPLSAAVVALSEELTGGKIAALLADGTVNLITVAADTGAIAIAAEIKSDAGPIQKINGHGLTLLTTAADRTVQNWKIDDASQVTRFDLPAAIAVMDVDSATDRAIFVLADGQALLWSLKEPKQIAALTADLLAQRQLKRAETTKAVLDSRASVIKGQIDEAEKEITAQREAETKAKADVEKQTPVQAEAKTKHDAAVAATAAAKVAIEGKTDDETLKKAVMEAEKAEAAAREAFTKADSELNVAKKSLDFATQAIARAELRATETKKQHELATQEATTAGATVEERKAPAAQAVAAAFAGFVGDGRYVLTGDGTGTLRVWNSADGSSIDVLPGTNVGAPAALMKTAGISAFLQTADNRLVIRSAFPEWQLSSTLGGKESGGDSVFVDRVLSLAFSPDGTLLAAGGGEASRSGQLTLWNVADGTLVHQFTDAHSDTVYGIDFSADGKLLASAAADKFVKVFDVATKQFVRAFEGHTHHAMDVSWKGDRTILASAGADNAIKIWNAETGEQARTIATYTRQVTSVQFVGLQDMILSGSGDKRVFFHTASNGNPAREFKGNPDYVYRTATNTDGTLVVSGGEDGVVRVWNGADAAEIAKFAPPQ
jgi:WD40 repeat protein